MLASATALARVLLVCIPMALVVSCDNGQIPRQGAASPPESYKVTQGERFSVSIALSGYAGAGGNLAIAYDNEMLRAHTLALDPAAWKHAVVQATIDNKLGSITDIRFSSEEGDAGKEPVVNVTFEALASGSSEILLGVSAGERTANGQGAWPVVTSAIVKID